MDTACPKQVRLGGFDGNEYLALHLVSVFSSNVVPRICVPRRADVDKLKNKTNQGSTPLH